MHAVIARNQQLVDGTLADPTPLPHDVVVAVDAVAINPHDVKALARVTGDDQQVFGYDAVGRVVAMGDQAQKYQVGDRIMYAGSAVRPGAWAEQEAVDERLTALVPDALTDWAPLAGMPLTSLTAWEILFDKVGFIPAADANLGRSVLVLNGAGGVGSILSQLAHWAGIKVYATASPRHYDWLRQNGVDVTLDYHEDLEAQMAGTTVDATINLMGVDQYLTESVHLTRPFGHIVNVGGNDDHFPIRRLQSRAQSLDWELMFTKSKYGYELDSQGEILSHVLQLLVDGTIHHTTTTIIRGGIDAAHLNQARTQLETGHQAGKIVITRE